MMPRRPVLIATLGTRPPVVTLAVDVLAEDHGVPVEEVFVIHTSGDRVRDALARLRVEFSEGRYRGRRCLFTPLPILTLRGAAVYDIRSRKDADSAFRTIYRAVRQRKDAGEIVHFSIAGGRNSMVAYGAATAQMLFDADDRLWHIISTEDFERSGRLHRRSRLDAFLAPVPVQSWSEFLHYALDAWSGAEDPLRALEIRRQSVERQADLDCEMFLKELTPAERRVVVDFVAHGGTDREIADRLGRSHRTVGTHLREIYSKMQAFFDYAHAPNRSTLMQQFAGFFDRHPHLNHLP